MNRRNGGAYDNDNDMQSRKGASTIDILEDCLEQIYEARKAHLMAKQSKNAKQLLRRQQRASRVNRPKTPLQGDQEAFFDESVEDADTEGVIDMMMTSSSYDKDAPDAEAAFGSQFKKDINDRTNSNKSQNINKLDMGTFSSLEKSKDDLSAATYFNEFRVELCDWWSKNNIKTQDEDARTELADFLTEKYMSKKLDPLPPSKIVSHTRKKLVGIIEELAKPGLLPHDFPDIVFRKKQDEEFLNVNKELNADNMVKKNALLTSEEYQQKLNADDLGHEIKAKEVKKTPTPSQSREMEKQKIKDQYETYMRYKKQVEQGEIENQAQQAQADAVMSLADDIQSLLGSVQKSNNDMASKELDAKIREERKK